MEVRQFGSFAPLLAVIGAAVLSSQTLTIGLGAAAAGHVAILLVLFAFDGAIERAGAQSLAFAGAAGFCLLTPFHLLAIALSPASLADRPYWTMPAAWIAATLLLFAVDRFRMSSRQPMGLAEAGLSAPMPFAPVRNTPIDRPIPPVVTRFENAELTVNEESGPVLVTHSHVDSGPVAPASDVTAIPPGREAVIYLNLVGEGLNVLRTVRAENLGRDYYRIADVMPEGEMWQFTPGQVVRCRKKSLSNGKHLVAFEEAPRA